MITYENNLRVLYGDTDKMGVVYYGNYARFFESGRTEMMRHLGVSYDSLEKEGILMPIVRMDIEYFKPAKYDDLLTIRTSIRELPGSCIRFFYEIMNESGELLNSAYTDLAFISEKLGRPVRPPAALYNVLKKHFK